MLQEIKDLESRLRDEFDRKISALREEFVNAPPPHPSMELSLVQQQIETAKSEIFGQIVDEINEKVVPQMNTAMQWVSYNMQDGGEVVDGYRRAFEQQTNKLDPNVKLLGYGKTDNRIISPHVRTFFGGPDEDSSSEDQ